jgi:hypothetical protein
MMIKVQNEEQLQDRELRDGAGRRIGRIRAVACSGTDRYAAAWALVDLGPLRRSRLVPLDAARLAADGSVQVPYPRDLIAAAPAADDADLAAVAARAAYRSA